MTAQDLKNAILQLAMQGKLVPQDPMDEPASELLKRIQTVKAQQVKNGLFIDKRHTSSKITDGDIPYDLPNSWTWVRFADIVSFSSGKTPERHNAYYWKDATIPWISISDIESDGITMDSREKISPLAFKCCFANAVVPAGTLIMSFKLTIGKVSFLGVDATHNEAIISIFPFATGEAETIIKHYLFKILPLVTASGNYKNAVKGKTLNATSISNLMIPLPPLAEQQRIVAKIEELLPLIEEYNRTEKRLTALDKKFRDQLRKSILQQAIMGKLTERAPTDEPASELLKRIRAEKVRLIKEGKLKKEKPLPTLAEDDYPFDIPDEWEWVRLTDIGEVSRGRSKNRPRNDPSLFEGGIYPFIQTGDVAQSAGTIFECHSFYNEKGLSQSRMWPKGTLCLTIAANIGDVGILNFDACFPDSVIGFNAFHPMGSNKYFLYMLMAYKAVLDSRATKSAQKNINLDTLASLAYPLPPLAEQQRIVERVEELLAVCGQLK